MHFHKSQCQQAIAVAKNAIEYGLLHQQKIPVDVEQYDWELQQQACCFVTLFSGGKLRGCIGALQAYQPLVKDIAEHAFGAAFKDYRFSPLRQDELDGLEIEISVLTPQTPIAANSEQELLEHLVEGEDGLTLDDGLHKATFLPSVWQQLPDKKEFILHLKRKAGLGDNVWPSNMKAYRYHAIKITEQ